MQLRPTDLVLLQVGHPWVMRMLGDGFSFPGLAMHDVALALASNEVDVRQLVQQAGMTLHGSAKPLDTFVGLDFCIARVHNTRGEQADAPSGVGAPRDSQAVALPGSTAPRRGHRARV